MVHTLIIEAGTVPSEGTQAAEIKVMAYHVYEFHSSSVLGEAILVLTFWDAHQILDVKVGGNSSNLALALSTAPSV